VAPGATPRDSVRVADDLPCSPAAGSFAGQPPAVKREWAPVRPEGARQLLRASERVRSLHRASADSLESLISLIRRAAFAGNIASMVGLGEMDCRIRLPRQAYAGRSKSCQPLKADSLRRPRIAQPNPVAFPRLLRLAKKAARLLPYLCFRICFRIASVPVCFRTPKSLLHGKSKPRSQ